ncbi:MAG: NADP-dependent oxidoreductase [Quisquiliibacterium sp.]
MPSLADGELLIRNHYLSLDPYMRMRMNDTKSYTAPQALDHVMVGGTAGEVIESRNPGFSVGEMVIGMLGWQQYGVSNGSGLRKVDTTKVPLSAFLGVVGMPGVTAWWGTNGIIEPNPGHTFVVSAASGAVGATAGQLAKLKGCKVVGVAGGPDKCRLVREAFGFDACVDYKAGRLQADLAAATPDGIDGYFDNVGGAVLDEVLSRMNAFGRIAVCGLISGYSGEAMPISNFRSVLVNRLRLQGFIISEQPQAWAPALAELAELVAAGRMKYRETIAHGIEAAPEAFLGLLKGENLGKQLVKLSV